MPFECVDAWPIAHIADFNSKHSASSEHFPLLITSNSCGKSPNFRKAVVPCVVWTICPYKWAGIFGGMIMGRVLQFRRLYPPSSLRTCSVRLAWVSASTSKTYLLRRKNINYKCIPQQKQSQTKSLKIPQKPEKGGFLDFLLDFCYWDFTLASYCSHFSNIQFLLWLLLWVD